MNFVNLYIQTEYSMLQSACKISSLLDMLVQYGFHECAMVDDGNMHGAIQFYKECQKRNLKPIIGLKVVYRFGEKTSHLLLYAMNTFGYKNLMKIASKAKLSNGIVDLDYLQQASLGVLAIIPCSENIVFDYMERGHITDALQHIDLLKQVFSLCYMGLARQSRRERASFELLYQTFTKNQCKMVAMSRVNYIHTEDVDVFQTLLSIRNGGSFYQLMDGDENLYLYQPEEIEIQFQGYESLIDNTVEIANKCEVEIKFGEYLYPKYQEGLHSNAYLHELCKLGLEKRLAMNHIIQRRAYDERLSYELDTICSMGFSDYFLIVWDFIKFAKNNGIYVGPGRGSAPASLVSYSLGITDIDPLEYGLLFERFLNKERITMPDIDTDFPDDVRDQVIQYVGQKYGPEHVAHIVTFGTFKIKLAIRDCARVYKMSEQKLRQMMKYIPDDATRKATGIHSLTKLIAITPALKQYMDEYDDIAKILQIACKLEGLPRNTSTHAAGIVITHHDLVHYTPLDVGLDQIYQTQYEASDLEALGLLKMDFLGLRNLTNINKSVHLIKQDQPDFSLPSDMSDQKVFQMLAGGDVAGVFQLESDGMRKLIMDLQTSHFNDIVLALALYRPGPMDMIPIFVKRKFGQEVVSYPHPDLEPILKETYGTIVYQEQIMMIAYQFAGYSLGRADILRRAVSKKNRDLLENERTAFVLSSIQKGYSKETAEEIYDYIVKFANYGFNKAHSVAYAKVAYQTAFLKCHYPEYYLSTLMTSVIGSASDMTYYYQEALRKGIKVVGPSISLSQAEFCVINHQIVFPLSVISGLGVVKTTQLLQERKDQPFVNFEDFLVRTKDLLPSSLLENIIYSGALDAFGLTKKSMIDQYQSILHRKEYAFVNNVIQPDYSDEEFTYGDLLTKEKTMLGLNIKYNFFYQYQALYLERHLQKVSDAVAGKRIQTLGILQKIKEIKTKQGETMAFATLEDDTSTIELTFFPRVYNLYRQLVIGQVAIVYGTVQLRKDLQIIVDEVQFI